MSTDLGGETDAELIGRVRTGESAAFAALYARHRDAAVAFARRLSPEADVEDLVAEGFLRVLEQLRGDAGPSVSLRPYLLTTVKNLHIRRSRRDARLIVTEDEGLLDSLVEGQDVTVRAFDRSAAIGGFRSLPERWQTVLWRLDVEQRPVRQVATELGLSPNAISALAVRAREGLRLAYLRAHLENAHDEACQGIVDGLPSYVRGTAAQRTVGRIEAHLPTCVNCTAMYAELREVNSRLAWLVVPALVVIGSAGHLTTGLAAQTAGPALVVGRRVREVIDVLRSNLARVPSVVVVGGLGAIAGVVVLLAVLTGPPDGDSPDRIAGAAPTWRTSTPAPVATSAAPIPTRSVPPVPSPSVPSPRALPSPSPSVPSPRALPSRPTGGTSSARPRETPTTPRARATSSPTRPVAAASVRSVDAVLTQRGASAHVDLAVVVRSTPGVQRVRVKIQLPAGAEPANRSAGSCRRAGPGLICEPVVDAGGTARLEASLRCSRSRSVTVEGAAEALAGHEVVDTERFVAERALRSPSAVIGSRTPGQGSGKP